MNTKMLCLLGALALAIPSVATAAPMTATRSADLTGSAPATDATPRERDGAKLELAGYFYHRHHHFFRHRFFHHRFYRHHRFFHRRFFHHHRHFY